MWQRSRLSSARGYQAPGQDLEVLITRMRRLATHRGFDRRELGSPLLKRLMPVRALPGGPAAETAELRRRLQDASLDGNAVAYLIAAAESELDLARLRLT